MPSVKLSPTDIKRVRAAIGITILSLHDSINSVTQYGKEMAEWKAQADKDKRDIKAYRKLLTKFPLGKEG